MPDSAGVYPISVITELTGDQRGHAAALRAARHAHLPRLGRARATPQLPQRTPHGPDQATLVGLVMTSGVDVTTERSLPPAANGQERSPAAAPATPWVRRNGLRILYRSSSQANFFAG